VSDSPESVHARARQPPLAWLALDRGAVLLSCDNPYKSEYSLDELRWGQPVRPVTIHAVSRIG